MNKLEKLVGGLIIVVASIFPQKANAQPPGFNPAELPMITRGIISQATVLDSVFAYNKNDNNLVGKTNVFYDDVSKDNAYNMKILTDLADTPKIEGPKAGDELYFRLKQDEKTYELNAVNGQEVIHNPGQIERWDFNIGTVVGVEEDIPRQFALQQNFPNPFNPSTTIRYDVGEKSNVLLNVYNISGQKVRTLVDEVKDAGSYQVNFDGSNLSAGVYFFRMESGNYTSIEKGMLIK